MNGSPEGSGRIKVAQDEDERDLVTAIEAPTEREQEENRRKESGLDSGAALAMNGTARTRAGDLYGFPTDAIAERCGTNAIKWADAFREAYGERGPALSSTQAVMSAWFALAIQRAIDVSRAATAAENERQLGQATVALEDVAAAAGLKRWSDGIAARAHLVEAVGCLRRSAYDLESRLDRERAAESGPQPPEGSILLTGDEAAAYRAFQHSARAFEDSHQAHAAAAAAHQKAAALLGRAAGAAVRASGAVLEHQAAEQVPPT